MPKSAKRNAQRERTARRMLRKSVEQQVRLAYAKVPKEAPALCAARFEVRAWLVSSGYLTVEELEALTKDAAIATARRRLDERLAKPPDEQAPVPA